MSRLKGLGRGLDALLSAPDAPETTPAPQNNASVTPAVPVVESELQTLSVTLLQPGKYQPRTKMDEVSLNELAASIKEQGLMQPIIARKVSADRFEIIAGERRWRAAKIAGLVEVPVLVKKIPDQTALAWSLIENIQREDLNPLEEAQGFDRLMNEFHLTHETLAQAVGRSRSAVTNTLRLLQLSPAVQSALSSGYINSGHARALLVLSAPQQQVALTRIIKDGLSVREAERLAQSLLSPSSPPRKTEKKRDADTIRLEEELSESLGARVQIDAKGARGGKVIIHYAGLDTLDGIIARLK
ncbi:MAG: ParB/RepB/Spo0J family partition protein [Burkholderiales bacterium]|jgi:ParB family chromosome partitioning protein|nr:ParB/RepB/Spo0J family partition protein [Burkholderiales bacterium]